MRTSKKFMLGVILVGALAGAAAAQSQTQTADQTQPQVGTSPGVPVTTVDQAIDRVIAREHDELATIRRYNPIIETYIQDMKPDKDMGSIPVKDHYFLGQADLAKGVVDNSMLTRKKGKLDAFNPISHLGGMFTSSYVPEGFLQMIYLDTNGFDRQHYQFDYVRREFLGEVRCLVFDVTPKSKTEPGRFAGRIWVEDRITTWCASTAVTEATGIRAGTSISTVGARTCSLGCGCRPLCTARKATCTMRCPRN